MSTSIGMTIFCEGSTISRERLTNCIEHVGVFQLTKEFCIIYRFITNYKYTAIDQHKITFLINNKCSSAINLITPKIFLIIK